MSDFKVYLTVPDYLAEWLTHTFGNPVVLIKDSPESRLLNELLCKLPADKEPDFGVGSNVAVVIPYFKGKDPAFWNYLHDTGKVALTESFTTLFKKSLFNEVTDLNNGHVKRRTIIYAYMERHGIDERHWDTVAQIYHRMKVKYKKSAINIK